MPRSISVLKCVLRDEIARAQYIHDMLDENGDKPLKGSDAEFLRTMLLGRARDMLTEFAFTGEEENAAFLHNYLEI